MIVYALACLAAAVYAGCYAVHALKRRRWGALTGALLLALISLACGYFCLSV